MGGLIKLFTAPIRSIVRFPLVQLAAVVALITFLQAADDNTDFGQLFNILDKLVDSTVISAIFNVRSFTRSWLISGFMIAYVYLACLLLLSLMRLMIRAVVDFIGRSNAFWLRDAIARERGIAAYRAWVSSAVAVSGDRFRYAANCLQLPIWILCVPAQSLRAFMSSIMRWRSGVTASVLMGNSCLG
jgi:hypothetical protein